MVYAFAAVVIALACFGLGRVKHPANLKLSAVKTEIAKLESEAESYMATEKSAVYKVVDRIKALL